jgi:hypothetical protein
MKKFLIKLSSKNLLIWSLFFTMCLLSISSNKDVWFACISFLLFITLIILVILRIENPTIK